VSNFKLIKPFTSCVTCRGIQLSQSTSIKAGSASPNKVKKEEEKQRANPGYFGALAMWSFFSLLIIHLRLARFQGIEGSTDNKKIKSFINNVSSVSNKLRFDRQFVSSMPHTPRLGRK
jgi:hypothetical protein